MSEVDKIVEYYVTDAAGNALRAGRCFESQVELQAAEGETVHVGEAPTVEAEPMLANYAYMRRVMYPSTEDQFDTIFHEGLDAWKAQIQSIKDTYPKDATQYNVDTGEPV